MYHLIRNVYVMRGCWCTACVSFHFKRKRLVFLMLLFSKVSDCFTVSDCVENGQIGPHIDSSVMDFIILFITFLLGSNAWFFGRCASSLCLFWWSLVVLISLVDSPCHGLRALCRLVAHRKYVVVCLARAMHFDVLPLKIDIDRRHVLRSRRWFHIVDRCSCGLGV